MCCVVWIHTATSNTLADFDIDEKQATAQSQLLFAPLDADFILQFVDIPRVSEPS